MITEYGGIFPSHFATKKEKDTKKYGLEVYGAILTATRDWRQTITKNLAESRRYAEGKQDIKAYLDELEIDGKNMYTNISYRPRPIAQKFIRAVVGGYSLRNEYPEVNSTSKFIKDRKDRKKFEAKFRMENKELIQQLSQQAGVQLEDPSAFTPESQEELELHFSINDKEREEILMQEMINFALKDNDIETLKNQILYEQFVGQLNGLYNYIDHNGRLCVDFIQAEDIITDSSFREDFKDAKYKGRFLRMTVQDIRKNFNLDPQDEKRLFDYVNTTIGKYGNPNKAITWLEDYRYSSVRPYDNYTVEVAHIWYKTAKILTTVEGKDRYGRTTFDVAPEIPNEIKNRQGRKVQDVDAETAYEGFFTADGSVCLDWSEQRNILRAGEDKDTLLSPFIFFMPENTGRMIPNSMMSMIIDSIRVMDITILKMKQALAKAVPDDWIIDIDGLMELDLGTGNILDPLEVSKIHQQTGRLYFRGKDEEGNATQPPIRSSNSALDVKLQGYVNIYNNELANIRDYLGVNEFRDGSAVSPRTSFKFLQAQTQASSTTTWFIYRAYIKQIEELIKQIGIRIWDTLNYGKENKGYLKYLGKENVEFIQKRKDITASSYDIEFSLGISDDDKATLEQYVQTCLAQGTLQMPDALMINRIKDPYMAERMLTFLYNKRRREAAKDADDRSRAQAESSAQAGVMVEQEKQKTAQLDAEVTISKEKIKGEQARDLEMERLAWKLIENEALNGTPIPAQYKGIVDAVLQNRGLNVVQETEQKEASMEQQAMQEQQQQLVQELEQGIQSGEISQEEAQQIAMENGLQ